MGHFKSCSSCGRPCSSTSCWTHPAWHPTQSHYTDNRGISLASLESWVLSREQQLPMWRIWVSPGLGTEPIAFSLGEHSAPGPNMTGCEVRFSDWESTENKQRKIPRLDVIYNHAIRDSGCNSNDIPYRANCRGIVNGMQVIFLLVKEVKYSNWVLHVYKIKTCSEARIGKL